jgi:NADH-quinone oxidoreductase subunit E
MVELDDSLRKQIEEIVSAYPQRQAGMLPVLHLMQERFGAISDDVIRTTAEVLGVSAAKVYGVITFYTLFKRPWEGKHVIWVCSTLPCALQGSEKLYDLLKDKLKVDETGTTPDGLFTLKKQECLGACEKAVCVQVDDEYHFNVTPEVIDKILDEIRAKEQK